MARRAGDAVTIIYDFIYGFHNHFTRKFVIKPLIPGINLAHKKTHPQFEIVFYYIFQTKCLLEKALPEPSLRYLSKAYALYLSVNAI